MRKIGMFLFLIAALTFLALTLNIFGVNQSTNLRFVLWTACSFGMLFLAAHFLTQQPSDRNKSPNHVKVLHLLGLAFIAIGLILRIINLPFQGYALIIGFLLSAVSYILEKSDNSKSSNSDLIDSE